MAVTPGEYERGFDRQVADVVADAAARVPGFRQRLADAGLQAAELADVPALDRLPVLSKDALLELQRNAPPFGGMLADDATPRRVFQSPGPLYEPETADGDSWRWGAALQAADIGHDDVALITFGFHLSPAGAMFEAACIERGVTVVPAGVGNKDLQVQACRDLGVTAYIGTPSYLRALLDAAADGGQPLAIDKALVTAEPLPPDLRASLEADVPLVRQAYGTAETGNLGFECEVTSGLHVPDDALVQVVDLSSGEALHDDRRGQVVVTLFHADYPIIRFGTGDLSSWLLEPCACGRQTPRIAGWQGRVGDAVKVKGMFLHPRQVDDVLGRLADVAAYRLVIDRSGHQDVVRCEVVPTAGTADVAARVHAAIRDGLRFNAEVTIVDAVPDGQRFEDVRQWS